MTVESESGRAARVEPRRHGHLRRAISHTAEVSCALLGGRRFYRRRFLSRERLVVREEEVAVEVLPAGLEGLTVVQLSDLHGGVFLRRGDLREVVDVVNELEPDVIALTGDYLSHQVHDALPLAEDLARLRPRLGSFAVFGNHDYRGRREARIAERYGEVGIRFLRNEGVRIDTGDGVLAIAGIEDLEEAKWLEPEAAREGQREGDVEVLLCHNPLGAPVLATERTAVVLSGHTHGNQVDLPLLRRLGPTHPGLRLELGRATLIVSRGLGVVALPLRVGAPAEVVRVRLTGRTNAGAGECAEA